VQIGDGLPLDETCLSDDVVPRGQGLNHNLGPEVAQDVGDA
jgi:hypothetical protein